MDPLFPDKVRGLNVEDESIKMKLPILDCYFTNQPEWDPTGAGKNLPVAELLCRWANVIQEYYAQEEVRTSKIKFNYKVPLIKICRLSCLLILLIK